MYKVAIFGTGSGALKVKSALKKDIDIVVYIDNNKQKDGEEMDGTPIIHPDRLEKVSFDFVIIGSQFFNEIKEQLLNLTIPNKKIISFFELRSVFEKGYGDIYQQLFDIDKILYRKFPDVTFSTLDRGFTPKIAQADGKEYKNTILLVNHLFGGGAQVYQDNLSEDKRKQGCLLVTLNIFLNQLVFIDITNNEKKKGYIFRIDQLTQKYFNNILSTLKIDLIYINQLVSFPVFTMIDFIKNSNVPYAFFIHDFFSVCPNYNLINFKNKYCFAETNINICSQCLSQGVTMSEISGTLPLTLDIAEWREKFHDFLSNAAQIIVPSENTKKIINKYYQDLDIDVVEHALNLDLDRTFDEKTVWNEKLNIGFVGSINKAKGSKIIYELKELIEEHALPVKLTVIGTTQVHQEKFISDDGKFEVTGPYKRSHLANLLRDYQIAVCIIPAICPETYNYTASEILAAGYPIISYDIGAHADRVKQKNGGWVLEELSVSSVFNLIKKLLVNRQEIIEKALHLN